MTSIFFFLLPRLISIIMNSLKVSALNTGVIKFINFPEDTFTAPNSEMLFLVGACNTKGSFSSGGTHIVQREPCCWKWHSSRLQISFVGDFANFRSFFKSPLCCWISLSNHRSWFPSAKTKLMKNPLALTNSNFDTILVLQVICQ